MVGLSGASEDYLKAMFHISHRGEAVTTGLLAAELGVASPSVTAMIKRLQANERVDRAGDARAVRLRVGPVRLVLVARQPGMADPRRARHPRTPPMASTSASAPRNGPCASRFAAWPPRSPTAADPLRVTEYTGGHDLACWRGDLADGLAALTAPW